MIRLDLTSGASSQLYPEPPRPNGELDEAAKGSIYSVACMPDARALAAGTSGGAIVVIDPRSSLRVATLSGHTDNVRAVALSHDGSLLLSGSSDRTIRCVGSWLGGCLAAVAATAAAAAFTCSMPMPGACCRLSMRLYR